MALLYFGSEAQRLLERWAAVTWRPLRPFFVKFFPPIELTPSKASGGLSLGNADPYTSQMVWFQLLSIKQLLLNIENLSSLQFTVQHQRQTRYPLRVQTLSNRLSVPECPHGDKYYHLSRSRSSGVQRQAIEEPTILRKSRQHRIHPPGTRGTWSKSPC